MKPDKLCEECGGPTTNPRFCSRSCASKYNAKFRKEKEKKKSNASFLSWLIG